MKKNNALSVLFAFVMTLTIFAVSAAAMEGDGTPESPLQISIEEDLLAFAGRVEGGERSLWADLTADLTIDEWDAIGVDPDAAYPEYAENPRDSDTPYAGVFNGNGHKLILIRRQPATSIDGYGNITGEIISNIALFHTIATEGTVKNLNLDVDFYGYYNVAGVAVRNYGTIERVTVDGTIEGSRPDPYMGGIVAYNGKGRNDGIIPAPAKILHCVNKADVTPGVTFEDGEKIISANILSGYVGGIAGAFVGEMRFCGNEGTITGDTYTGGLAGCIYQPMQTKQFIISDCYNTGEIFSPIAPNATTAPGQRGSVIGYVYDGAWNWGQDYFKISNVFCYGEITGGRESGTTHNKIIIGGFQSNNYTDAYVSHNFSNIYYLDGIGKKLFTATNPNGTDGLGTDLVKTVIKSKPEVEFASAKMAALLNNGRIGAFAPWEYIEGNNYPTLKPSTPPDDTDVVDGEVAETIREIIQDTKFTATDETIVYMPAEAVIAYNAADLSTIPTGGAGSVVSQSDLVIGDGGRVYVSPDKIKELAAGDESLNERVNSGAGILSTPVIEVDVEDGKTALFSYSTNFSKFAGAKIGDLTLVKTTPYGLRLPQKVSGFADLADERYIITDEEGAVIADSEVITGSKNYVLTVGVKDDGNYDWDKTDGHIIDPYAVGAPDNGPGTNPDDPDDLVSGGGGCDAGAAGMTAMAAAALLLTIKRRKG